MRYEIIECVQGDDVWHEARRGLPTSSRYPDILAQGEGKMRGKYRRQIAYEIISGELMESYSNEKMDRGKEHEPDLRARYAFDSDVDVQKIGFVKMNPQLCRTGCSPDGLVGDQGMVEFKSMEPHLLIEMLERESPPISQAHMAQIQGGMWIMERKWCDLVVGWPKLPLLIRRVPRDEPFIGRLINEVKMFNIEVDQLVSYLKDF